MAYLARFAHPRLIGSLLGGIGLGILGGVLLLAAVPVGITISTGAGVALTWIAIVSGGTGFMMVIVGVGGYLLQWIS